MVVDEDTGKLLGEVPGIDGAHGTAIATATGHGFATSGNDGTVVMFDLKTFKPLGRIPAAEDADAIIYDPASKRVFTFNGDAHSSTVIDPQAGTDRHNIPLGGKPEYGASAGDGKVYGNLTDISEVVEIDAKTRESDAPVVHRALQAAGLDGHRLAHHRLFSGCRSGVMAVSDTRPARSWPRCPSAAAWTAPATTPRPGDAFASNADGTLTVIHEDSPDAYHVVRTCRRRRARGTWAWTPRTIVCSWSRPSSGRRPLRPRRIPGRAQRCCRARSRCW